MCDPSLRQRRLIPKPRVVAQPRNPGTRMETNQSTPTGLDMRDCKTPLGFAAYCRNVNPGCTATRKTLGFGIQRRWRTAQPASISKELDVAALHVIERADDHDFPFIRGVSDDFAALSNVGDRSQHIPLCDFIDEDILCFRRHR